MKNIQYLLLSIMFAAVAIMLSSNGLSSWSRDMGALIYVSCSIAHFWFYLHSYFEENQNEK